ncbi:MAG TPA: ketopantoate reductase C-terminal domain-containing protein [Mycobacterium sp.]|nr:ketopantoate reductase C-terminal domain-containing protein [Mycobacterium sp.]
MRVSSSPRSPCRRRRALGSAPRPVPGWNQRGRNSTWQSLIRQTGDVETDFLNGEIVRLAHRLSMAAPVNSVLASPGREAAREGQGPGRYTASQLAALLGSAA